MKNHWIKQKPKRPMGFGLFQQPNIRFVNKIRWTFQGWDQNGKEVFPEAFVKVSARPAWGFVGEADEEGKAKLSSVPGELTITQFFGDWQDYNNGKEDFEKHNGFEVKSAQLRLYDGCGIVIEDWSLSEVLMLLFKDPGDFETDGIVDWLVQYQRSDYNAHGYYESLFRK